MRNTLKYRTEMFEEKEWQVENEKKILFLLVSVQELLGNLVDYGNYSIPSERLLYLLEHMRYKTIAKKISLQLEKSGMNKRTLIYYLTRILCKYPYSKKLQDNMDLMSLLPGIQELYSIKNGYTFVTTHGTITVYRANQILTNTKLYHQMKLDNSFYLHTLLAPLFPKNTIMSCLMSEWFDGFFYESYMQLEQPNGIVNLIDNTFYPDNSFEDFFKPKILVKEVGKNLDYEIPPLLAKSYECRKKTD